MILKRREGQVLGARGLGPGGRESQAFSCPDSQGALALGGGGGTAAEKDTDLSWAMVFSGQNVQSWGRTSDTAQWRGLCRKLTVLLPMVWEAAPVPLRGPQGGGTEGKGEVGGGEPGGGPV